MRVCSGVKVWLLLAGVLSASTCGNPASAATVSRALQERAAGATATASQGALFSSEKLNALLPPSVYFQGKTAPLQLRNAAGITFPNGQIVWMALVDTSGYSTAVQEKYQFYLVSEGPLRLGSASLPAGAYGAC